MRGRDFLDKMELVSPIYVEGADQIPIIRPKQWPKFVVAAACLCLMAWGAWSFTTGGFGQEPGYVASTGESEGVEGEYIEADGMTLEPCPGTLGFDQCWVRYDGTPDAANWWYYTDNGNGRYKLVAESWWNAKSAAPYEADLDGDGVKELIFNLNYEDGLREIQIIRHGDGEIQNWYFNNEFLRNHWEEQGLTTLEGATEHIRSYYDPARGIVLEADCYDAEGKQVLSVEVFHDLEHFKYFTENVQRHRDPIDGEPLEEPSPQPSDPIGEPIIERCPGTLGFDECWVIREKDVPGTHRGYFYARMDDGTLQCIAEACACFDELDVYRVDIDGDGVDELICNNTGGDSVQEVYIYRNCGIGIEVGWLAWGYWDLYGFDTMGAASARAVRYDPERGFVVTGYDLEGKPKEEIVQDMRHFRFEPYEPSPFAPDFDAVLADHPELFDPIVAPNSDSGEPCPATLGFENCMMIREELPTGITTWWFYAWENRQYRLIARTGNYANEPDVYRVDLDGDGVDELVCNREWAGDGQSVLVYRNRDGQIEQGWLELDAHDLLDAWAKEGLSIKYGGEHNICSHYDPEQGFVLSAHLADKDGNDVLWTETFQGLEHFTFEPYDSDPYEPDWATIPLGVATVKVGN